MKKFVLLIAICAFGLQGLWAQTRQITGTVTSADDGTLIPGVAVTVKGTTLGTVTGVDGKYVIKVPMSSKVLTFSFLGMTEKNVPITGNLINVKLKSTSIGVGMVTVTTYGSSQKLSTLVGSAATVTSDELENKPTSNIVDGLQGKVAGVMIYTSSGEPSETSSITIRGNGTLEGSSDPLIILDGMAVDNTTIMAMDPNDFASVTVLKDASATSIYGSRAANGVIVYTTKKGKRGGKGKISVSGMYGISNMAESKLWDNIFDTDGLLNFWEESGLYSESQVSEIKDEYGDNNTNWRDYYYRKNKKLKKLSLAYSGGSEKTDYYVSFNANSQEGLAYRSKFERYGTRINLNSQVNNWFKSGVNLNLSYTVQDKNPYSTNYLGTGLSYMAPPFYSPYDEDGNEIYGKIPGWNQYSLSYQEDMYDYDNNKAQLTGNIYAELTPIKGLRLKTMESLDAYDKNISTKRSADYAGALDNGYNYQYRYRKYQYQTTNTAEYKFDVDDSNHFTVLAGQEYIKYTYKQMYAGVYGITDDRLSELDDGTGTKSIYSGTNEYAYLSFFGNINYSRNDKYYGDFTLRQDQTSLLAKENRKGLFYSIGGRWKMKKEAFLIDTEWLNKLDFRASYGTQGRSVENPESDWDSPYEYYSLIGSNQYQGETGWYISTFGNDDLGWETQKQLSIGFDASAFKDRLTLTVEGYVKNDNDLHISVPYPYTSGVTEVEKNAASLKNTGIEIAISFDVLKGKDYKIEPYVNFAYDKEEITELFPQADDNGRYWPMDDYMFMWTVGKAQTYYAPIWAGVNSETGAPQWYVPGDDPSQTVKDPDNVTSTFSSSLSQNTGQKYHPDATGGFGVRANYKGLSLQADFAFQLDKYLVNNDAYYAENPTVFTSYNQSSDVTDYWKSAGDESKFPSLDYQFTQFDSRIIENASFLRLKTITVSYALPESLLKRTNFFGGANVFFTGRNLLTFTNYSGQDPEVDSNLTYGQNPNTKQISFGFNLTF